MITLNDIAGYESEKEAVGNIKRLFNDYNKFNKLGIRLPKGLIFYGKPGVGKTLFSKAIASEVKRKFFELKFDNHDEVGTINSLKAIFKKATLEKPSIVFIDEIDKIVPSNSNYKGFQSDQSRNVLSVLLQLLDGFESNGDVMVIATTNRFSYIPDALVRSGRIDQHIRLSEPDSKSRRQIFEFYANKIDYPKKIDIDQIVISLEGLTGADINTIVNETFIKAISSKKAVVTTSDVLKQAQIVMGKDIIKYLKDEEAEVVATHELGHFFAAKYYNKQIKDISINKTPESLGRIRVSSGIDVKRVSDILNEVTILLAGRAAEEVILDEIYVGSREDITKAQILLKKIILYGEVGLNYLNAPRGYVDAQSLDRKQERKLKKLFKQCYKKALEIVTLNKNEILAIKPILIKEKILSTSELHELLQS